MLRAAIAALALVATPAFASSHYQARPAAAPLEDRIVVKNAVWKRSGGQFEAQKTNSRPATVCATLVKKVGALESFSIAGAPISADDLQKCNARAR